MQEIYNKWTIVYVDFQDQYIHLDHLKKSNPDAQILLCDISNDLPKVFVWRNNDKFIREWFRSNLDKIQHNNIAILEWDVVVTIPLPDIAVNGFVGRNLQRLNINQWVWFNEINRLGRYKPYAMGSAPFCVQFMDRQCINRWVDQEFDDIYSEDIFCELRLPTILNYANVNMSEYSMPYVEWHVMEYYKDIPGIYHAIKHKV